MTISSILLLDFDAEISNTRRTLERVPDDKPDWAPHAKSMKLGKLAMHCATLPLFGLYILEDDHMDLASPSPKRQHADLTFTTLENALTQLDDSTTKCRAALATATDEQLSAMWKFSFGEHIIMHEPRAGVFRKLFFDHMIHHTSQLGVYLRLLDIPVPALYGPSADEQWSPK